MFEDEPGVARHAVGIGAIACGHRDRQGLQQVAIDLGLVRDPAPMAMPALKLAGIILANQSQLAPIIEPARHNLAGESAGINIGLPIDDGYLTIGIPIVSKYVG